MQGLPHPRTSSKAGASLSQGGSQSGLMPTTWTAAVPADTGEEFHACYDLHPRIISLQSCGHFRHVVRTLGWHVPSHEDLWLPLFVCLFVCFLSRLL